MDGNNSENGHREPRVNLPAGGTDIPIWAAEKVIAYVYENHRQVWANAMLVVFAPDFKAAKTQATKR